MLKSQLQRPYLGSSLKSFFKFSPYRKLHTSNPVKSNHQFLNKTLQTTSLNEPKDNEDLEDEFSEELLLSSLKTKFTKFENHEDSIKSKFQNSNFWSERNSLLLNQERNHSPILNSKNSLEHKGIFAILGKL